MKRLLSSDAGHAAAVLLAAILCLPSLGTGLVADDWYQKLHFEHRSPADIQRPFLAPFTFADGIPQNNQRLIDAGVFAWWADPEVRLSFLRPLAAATHALDFTLWPDSPWVMHLQSVLWFLLAVGAIAFLYRGLFPPLAAGLAILLFAFDHNHGTTVGWLANRNAIIALALAAPALQFHHRWRSEGWTAGAWLAPLSLAAGLLGGEAAIGIVGYLVAYAVHLDRGSWRSRVASLVPAVSVVLVWRLIYSALGYGAKGSGLYVDPGRELGRFLVVLPGRLAALLAADIAGPPADLNSLLADRSPLLALGMMVLALATVAGTVLAFAPLLRSDGRARMFATGGVLSAIPCCAMFPSDRLLLFVSIGVMGCLALFLDQLQAGLRRLTALGLAGIHLVIAPILLPLRAQWMVPVGAAIERAAGSLPPDVAGKTLVLVNPPGDLFAFPLPLFLTANNQPQAARQRWLAAGSTALTVTRDDPQTLTVSSLSEFTAHTSEQLVRSLSRPMPVGTKVQLTGLTIEVMQTGPNEQPMAARFHFDQSLEDASLVWMQWGIKGYVPFVPPPLGHRLELAPVDYLKALSP